MKKKSDLKARFNKKMAVSLLILFITLNSLAIASVAAITKQDSDLKSDEKIAYLKDRYLGVKDLKAEDQPLRGTGIDDEGKTCAPALGPSCDVILLEQNLITMAAFAYDYKLNRNQESLKVVKNDIFYYLLKMKNITDPTAGYRHSDEILENLNRRRFAIDQFEFMEFVAETYEHTELTYMLANLQEAFNYSLQFEAPYNTTLSNIAYRGAYWTALDNDYKVTNAIQDPFPKRNPIFNPFPDTYDIPNINISLWAALSFAHYAKVLKDYYANGEEFPAKTVEYSDNRIQELHNLGLKYSEIYYNISESIQGINSYELYSIAIHLAKEAMEHADLYGWNKSLELYGNFQARSPAEYNAENQVLAFLACVRLYEATGEEQYVLKANVILDSLMEKFWDVGQGGLFHTYKPNASPEYKASCIKYGFDNALLAYALVQLGEAQGVNEQKFPDFWKFKRPTNPYMDMAEDIIYFMNQKMWKVSESKDVMGYVEWINSTGQNIPMGDYDRSTRYANTNMLAFYTLNAIKHANTSFTEFYMNYIIYISIGFLAVVALLFLIRNSKQEREGIKTPSLVKGLMGKGD